MMKRILVFVSIVCCILSLNAQDRERLPVQFHKISDNLYETTGGRGARGGVYIGETGVLVIDAKMDSLSVKEVLDGIRQLTDKPVQFLVNTHSDGDHIQGNRYFPKSVTFVAHENCHKEFYHPKRNGSPSEWNEPALAPFIPSITFHEKMNIYPGNDVVELYYLGIGHTTGDIVVYFPEENVAFIGDQIFIGRPQLIHAYKGGNSFEHVKTLENMLNTLDAHTFYSGHSDGVSRGEVQVHIQKMKRLQQKIQKLVQEKHSLDDIIKQFEENQARLVETIYLEIVNQ